MGGKGYVNGQVCIEADMLAQVVKDREEKQLQITMTNYPLTNISPKAKAVSCARNAVPIVNITSCSFAWGLEFRFDVDDNDHQATSL